MTTRRILFLISSLCAIGSMALGSEASDGLRLGEFKVDPPTLHCLGFVWDIEHDANRNASASVRYCAVGTEAWREAQPLLRVGGHHTGRPGDWHDVATPDCLAGSILGLEPGAEYEVRFAATDPDGIQGEASRTVRCRTRTEPREAQGGRVYHVYPPPSGRTAAPEGVRAPAHPKGVSFIGGSPTGRGLFANAHFRNNIYLGSGRATFPTPGNAVTSDYNGCSEPTFAITPFDAASPILDASVEPPKALKQEPKRSDEEAFATQFRATPCRIGIMAVLLPMTRALSILAEGNCEFLPLEDQTRPAAELHDPRQDPWEQHSVAGQGAYAEIENDLSDRLGRWMRDTNDPALSPEMPRPLQDPAVWPTRGQFAEVERG